MSIGPENTFIRYVNARLDPRIYALKNHTRYNAGVADCWYSGPQGDLWAEYKFITAPRQARTTVALGLSALQRDWLHQRHKEGRNVAVIVGHKAGAVILRWPAWSQPWTAGPFLAQSCARKRVIDFIEQETL